MTPEEIEQFNMNGRNALTTLALGGDQLEKYAASFEARGGASVIGDAALEIVYLWNDLEVWLTPARQATIAKFRTDI